MITKKMYHERFGITILHADIEDSTGNLIQFAWRNRGVFTINELPDDFYIELKIDGVAHKVLSCDADKHHFNLWRPCVLQNWTPEPLKTPPLGYVFTDQGNNGLAYSNMLQIGWTDDELITHGYLVIKAVPVEPAILEPMSSGVTMPAPVAPDEYNKGMLDCVKKIANLIGEKLPGTVGYKTLPAAVEKAMKPFVPDNKPPIGSKVRTQLAGDVIEETEVLSYFKSERFHHCVTLEIKSGGFKTCPVSEWQYWPIDNRTDREKYIDDMADTMGENACKVTIGAMYDILNK
jgi:hypothetical protein